MMGRRWAKLFKSALILGCALLFLTGCGARGPENKIVQKAIALEFQQTQEALSQQLHTKVPKFKIKNIVVAEKEALRLGGLVAYHLQGQYDADVKFPGKRYAQTDYSFDVYLQQLPDGNLWRLAVPQARDDDSETVGPQWKTYALYEEVPEVDPVVDAKASQAVKATKAVKASESAKTVASTQDKAG